MNSLFEYTDELNGPIESFHHKQYIGNFPILPHWHHFIEIIYVTQGKLEVTCEENVYNLTYGDLIVFPPLKVHTIDQLNDLNSDKGVQFHKNAKDTRLYKKNVIPVTNHLHHSINPVPVKTSHLLLQTYDVEYHVLKLNLNYLYASQFSVLFSKALAEAIKIDGTNIYFPNEAIKRIPAEFIFERCMKEENNKSFEYQTVMSSYVTVLLAELMRIWINKNIHIQDILSQLNISDHFLSDITTYIKKHIKETISVRELANLCNMSYSTFSRHFKNIYNFSCKEYITHIRLRTAMDLMCSTNLDLSCISQETGFSDCSHMIRTFKHYTGITPRQWLEERKKNNI